MPPRLLFLPGEFPLHVHSQFPGAALLPKKKKKKTFQDFHESPSFTAVRRLLITHHSVHLSGIFKQIFLDGSLH